MTPYDVCFGKLQFINWNKYYKQISFPLRPVLSVDLLSCAWLFYTNCIYSGYLALHVD